MDIPIGHHHLHLGEPLTTLDKVTLAAMVALGPLTIAGMWFRDGVVTTQTLLFAATALLLAAVVATGRHWTPLLGALMGGLLIAATGPDRKSTRLNSSHANISYAVFCLRKKERLTT